MDAILGGLVLSLLWDLVILSAHWARCRLACSRQSRQICLAGNCAQKVIHGR